MSNIHQIFYNSQNSGSWKELFNTPKTKGNLKEVLEEYCKNYYNNTKGITVSSSILKHFKL